MDTSRRLYRKQMCPVGFVPFVCKIKETDLHIAVDQASYRPELTELTEQRILFYRDQLENYLTLDPEFRETLAPHLVLPSAPPIALAMARAGNIAGVGPMAAVAGAFAEYVGRDLLQSVKQVIVENGGDLFLATASTVKIAIFAGTSPFSNKIAIEAGPCPQGLGVCTSSGTVGPSLSFGRADAAVIVSPSTLLADAVATATANLIQKPDDIQEALAFAASVQDVTGTLLIKDDIWQPGAA